MNKIDWSKAPKWANYHALDEDGKTYWYEKKPSQMEHTWYWSAGRFGVHTKPIKYNWRDTLQERPKEI